MSHLMIRKIVKNILLETRGPLPIPVILREWVEVLAKHGVPRVEGQPYIQGPPGPGDTKTRAKTACLVVPSQHSQKVFDAFTPELQEYVLKHWRSEEYFKAMIEGVTLGIVKQYEKSNYAGMKDGHTSIQGAINDEGKMVGSMSGYLTTKVPNSVHFDQPDSPLVPSIIKGRHDHDSPDINKQLWRRCMLEDIDDNDSTLVHEFQHWFQESVYYAQSAIKVPTKRTGKSNSLPKPKERIPNVKQLKPIHLMMAKKNFNGIDWNTTMRIRGAIAYKITDAEAFFNSYNPTKEKGKYHTVPMERQVLDKIPTAAGRRKFIEELLYDYLKLQRHLDEKDLDQIASDVEKHTKHYDWNPIKTCTQAYMWEKGIQQTTTINDEKISQYKWDTPQNPQRDTPKGSGETTVQGTDSLMRSLGKQFAIYILKSTDFDKTGKLKAGRTAVPPTEARAKKATWAVFGHGVQKLPNRNAFTSTYMLKQKRGTDREKNYSSWQRPAWTDRWVEFDAVAAEYMVGSIKPKLYSAHMITHYLVQSDTQSFSEWVQKTVRNRLYGRGFRHQNLKVNEDHVESMADRIADRFVEVVEENPYEEWMKTAGQAHKGARTTSAAFDEWASGSRTDAPYSSRFYWQWIFKKASGEDV